MFKALKTYGQEIRLNGNSGMLSFVLHRLTGLALVAYLIPHLYSVGMSRRDADGQAFNATMAAYNTPLFHLAEYLLLLCVLMHLLHGLKITIADFFLKTRDHPLLLKMELGCFFAATIFALPVFFPAWRRFLTWW